MSSRQVEGSMRSTHDLEAVLNAKSWFGLVVEPSYDTLFDPLPPGGASTVAMDNDNMEAQSFTLDKGKAVRGVSLRVSSMEEEHVEGQLIVELKTSLEGAAIRTASIDIADLLTYHEARYLYPRVFTFFLFESAISLLALTQYFIVCRVENVIEGGAYWFVTNDYYPYGKGYQWSVTFGWIESPWDCYFQLGSRYSPLHGILEEQT